VAEVARFVALLRGVNVGKGKRVPMADLRALLEGLGFASVRTLLNSGNAVFDAGGGTENEHADAIAAALEARLGVATPVVVKTAEAWRRIVAGNPMAPREQEYARFLVAFGRTPEDVRSLAPLAASARDTERLAITDDAAYLAWPAGISKGEVAAAVLGRAGRRVTTRNWATVVKIDAILGEAADGVSAPGADLDAVLDAGDRHQRALLALLRLVPEGGLDARATPRSPTIGQMLAHMHHERLVSVQENAPEHAGEVPQEEWGQERDRERIAVLLEESARCVRDAVRARSEAGRALDVDFAHPLQLLVFLVFHEGYHHGQIKLALKVAGTPLADEAVGGPVWGAWRER
jgi:uncharacterized protein (DUF1697 family)/uncharacterized damage-inducible protein DinB